MTSNSFPCFPPVSGRAHEVCGAGACAFAFAMAAQMETRERGHVLWVREKWCPEGVNPNGFAEFIDPRDFMLCLVQDQMEGLAVAEEALRSGAVNLVVNELSKPLGLIEGRRLQLAARGGASTALGIIPQGMGSNAAETRWNCAPVFAEGDSTLQRWEIIKNKSGTLGAWYVRWDTKTRCITVVSPAAE